MGSGEGIDQELIKLPFDLYQRYTVAQAVARAAKERLGRPLNVLDVGGLGFTGDGERAVLPIRLCLPTDRCLTVDSQECDMEGYVRGVGEHLPFGDELFDVVVSCDTLEHVRPECRQGFIQELLRVSANYVVLIAPRASRLNALAEKILDHYITFSLGVEHRQLREHLDLGLPDPRSVLEILDVESALLAVDDHDLHCVDFESGCVYTWLTVMLARHYLLSVPNSSRMIAMFDEFYNVALANQDPGQPGYRHVFLISKRGDRDLLDDVKRRFSPQLSGGQPSGAELFQMGMTLLNMRKTEGVDQRMWREIAQKEAHIAHLRTLVSERDVAIEELRRALREYADRLEETRSALQKANLEKSITWRMYAAVSGAVCRAQQAFRSVRSG